MRSSLASLKYCKDEFQHTVYVLVDIAVMRADDFVSEAFKLSRASYIGSDLVGLSMCAAVNFDDQTRLPAEEVGEVIFDWRLPHEFKAVEMPVTEVRPMDVLG